MIYLVLLVLFVVLIVRQRANLVNALHTVQQANLNWLGVGVLAMGLSLPATALVYKALSPKPLRFGRTVLVQTAGFCINKLLPSGSGAAGTSYLYLRANKLPGVQAGSIVVLNNLLGFAGHFVLFWLLMVLQPSALQAVVLSSDKLKTWFGLAGCVLIALIGLTILLRAKFERLTKQLKPLLARRAELLKALGASMVITLCYVVSLNASAAAVGVNINLAAAIIALSASVLATSVVPTPGGIGAAEVGAYGGLVLVGVNPQAALAAAILYRVCTFWLPLIVGSVAFAVVVKRGYLRRSR
jgi:uncharacterized membrane protein YbhN (UPF0104 family)